MHSVRKSILQDSCGRRPKVKSDARGEKMTFCQSQADAAGHWWRTGDGSKAGNGQEYSPPLTEMHSPVI